MSRRMPAMDAFEDTMADAYLLVRIAEALQNVRKRAMRRELRERIGHALRIPKRQQGDLDCLESPDLFVAFKPGSSVRRQDFDDPRPLLRQALVAGCAATEAYLADRVMECINEVMTPETAPKELRRVGMTFGDWFDVDAVYSPQTKTSGLKYRVFEPWLRRHVSTHPEKVASALRLLDINGGIKRLNAGRGGRPDTESDLLRITERRNRIAHEGDRRGAGRAQLSAAEARSELDALQEIVAAFDGLTTGPFDRSEQPK